MFVAHKANLPTQPPFANQNGGRATCPRRSTQQLRTSPRRQTRICVHLYCYPSRFAQPAQISGALAHRLFAIGYLLSSVAAEPRCVHLWCLQVIKISGRKMKQNQAGERLIISAWNRDDAR